MVSKAATDVAKDTRVSDRKDKFYKAAWRWHFYAGLYVIPFFILLAVTGMGMTWIAYIDGRDGEKTPVIVQDQTYPLSLQAEAARAALPDGVLKQYIAPRAQDLAAIFRVDQGDVAYMVVVDPYTGQVLNSFPRRSGWYDFFDSLHSDLKLGVLGDRLIEISASLGIILLITGLYLWWPRGTGWYRAFVPTLSGGKRGVWKALHGAVGLWLSIFLLFFLISGLSWAGIWGEKLVQAWNSYPAERWDNVPLSDDIHASMNHGPKEVPWNLEQTPLPASGSEAGHAVLPAQTVIDLESMDQLARQLGFSGRYQMNIPTTKTGVYTISRDSMSTDSDDPTSDRTVHVDQYTGKILADMKYEDYSLMAQAMAVGIALHMGTLGLWSVLANSLVCLSTIFLAVSGVVMWWKRRPAAGLRLVAPPLPKDMPQWQSAVLIALFVSLAFPMAGLTLICVLALDTLVLCRIPFLKRLAS
ncbi:PepSY-associated TM helix domain-containing protein [Terasakiella pusilla]|uniref:PepSY-associated TM helix domain-containing protein n=1 Tax=Terasakiella pusilla TaxID=64973 RepID=UPI003AA83600